MKVVPGLVFPNRDAFLLISMLLALFVTFPVGFMKQENPCSVCLSHLFYFIFSFSPKPKGGWNGAHSQPSKKKKEHCTNKSIKLCFFAFGLLLFVSLSAILLFKISKTKQLSLPQLKIKLFLTAPQLETDETKQNVCLISNLQSSSS